MEYGIVAFVISSLLGSGIFVTPGLLIPNGLIGFIVFIVISILFFILGNHLGSVKSSLFKFLENQLGFKTSSLVLWSYWIISWASTSIVIIEMINYMGLGQSEYVLLYECLFVILFTFINWFGLKSSIKFEAILTWIKVIPLIIIPGICMWKAEGIIPKIGMVGEWGWIESIKRSIVSVLWLFVGIESGAIISKDKSYNKEISLGIIIVIFVYFINIYGISLINTSFSLTSYSDVLFSLFGSSGQLILNIFICFVLFNAINTWTIICSQLFADITNNNPKISTDNINYKNESNKGIIANSALMIIVVLLSYSMDDISIFNNLLGCAVNFGMLFYAFLIFGLYKYFNGKNKWILSLMVIFLLIFMTGNVLIPFGIMSLIYIIIKINNKIIKLIK